MLLRAVGERHRQQPLRGLPQDELNRHWLQGGLRGMVHKGCKAMEGILDIPLVVHGLTQADPLFCLCAAARFSVSMHYLIRTSAPERAALPAALGAPAM